MTGEKNKNMKEKNGSFPISLHTNKKMYCKMNPIYNHGISLQLNRRHGFSPWVGKIPWRKEWLPTPVFLPEKSHGQSSLVGYGPWSHRVGHD